MIDFSVQLIESSLKLCYSMHSEIKKRLYSEQERYKKIKNQLEQAKNNAIKDKNLAEKEKTLCQTLYNENVTLSEELKQEKAILEETINKEMNELAQLYGLLNMMKSMSDEEQSVDTSSIESQIARLEADIRRNQAEIKYINKKLSQIENANAKLIEIKNKISQVIVKLGEYITKCQQSEEFLTSSFNAFYNKARTFLDFLNYCEEKIKSAEHYAQEANNTLSSICSRHGGSWFQKPRIVIDSMYDLESLTNDWSRMCLKLNNSSGNLMNCTETYRKKIQDSVSKDVVKITSSIDQNLKEIYELLNDNSKKTSDFEWNLKDYLKCSCK